jgi:hypothetical protein
MEARLDNGDIDSRYRASNYLSASKDAFRYDPESAKIAKTPVRSGEVGGSSRFLKGGLAALAGHINAAEYNQDAYAPKFDPDRDLSESQSHLPGIETEFSSLVANEQKLYRQINTLGSAPYYGVGTQNREDIERQST